MEKYKLVILFYGKDGKIKRTEKEMTCCGSYFISDYLSKVKGLYCAICLIRKENNWVYNGEYIPRESV